MRWILVLLLTLGCGKSSPPEILPDSGGATAGATERVTAPADTPATSPEPGDPVEPIEDPMALYASCEGRVEQPESDGECQSDDDCARAGCSSEVCTTKADASDIMTTCEVQPCFAVLDTCGCVEGRCRWSVKDSVPPPSGPPIKLSE